MFTSLMRETINNTTMKKTYKIMYIDRSWHNIWDDTKMPYIWQRAAGFDFETEEEAVGFIVQYGETDKEYIIVPLYKFN